MSKRRKNNKPQPSPAQHRPVPQDHKPKQVGFDPDQEREFDYEGRSWTITPSALDDYEFLDMLGRAQDGDPTQYPRAMRRLLGDKQTDLAIQVMRESYGGKVALLAAAEWFRGLLEAIKAPNS